MSYCKSERDTRREEREADLGIGEGDVVGHEGELDELVLEVVEALGGRGLRGISRWEMRNEVSE